MEEAANKYTKLFGSINTTSAIYNKLLTLYPHKHQQLAKIASDRHRLRAAFIRTYTEVCSRKFSGAPGVEDGFDVRKYATFMEKEKLLGKIYARANVLLKNPKAYSEVVDICEECAKRGYDGSIKYMTMFKTIGVKEIVKLLGEFPELWSDKAKLKREIRNLLKTVMVRTRHYAKQQYDWLKGERNYFAIVNDKERIEQTSDMMASQIKNLSLQEHLELCQQQKIP